MYPPLPGSHSSCWGASKLLIVLGVVLALPYFAFAQSWPLVVCADAANLPYSHRSGEGFENRIATLIADEMGASVEFLWTDSPYARTQRLLLEQGDCDLLMAAADGQSGFETSLAYYRSSYVFVQRADHPGQVRNFDDAVLRSLSIGVLLPDGRNVSPPTHALVNRNLISNQIGFVADRVSGDGMRDVVDAVEAGTVDVAVVWGPVAGYFAASAEADMHVRPVHPQVDAPFVPMVMSVSIAMRAGDVDLKDLVNTALVQRWDDVQTILDAYGVPTLELPRPSLQGREP